MTNFDWESWYLASAADYNAFFFFVAVTRIVLDFVMHLVFRLHNFELGNYDDRHDNFDDVSHLIWSVLSFWNLGCSHFLFRSAFSESFTDNFNSIWARRIFHLWLHRFILWFVRILRIANAFLGCLFLVFDLWFWHHFNLWKLAAYLIVLGSGMLIGM